MNRPAPDGTVRPVRSLRGGVRPAGLLRGITEEAVIETPADLTHLRRLVPYLRRHALLLGVALLLMPVGAGASLMLPLLVKRAIDAVVAGRDRSVLAGIGLAFLAAIVVEFLARFGQTYTLQLAGQRVVADLRRAVFAHVQRLRVAYFDHTPIGRIVTRVTNDVDALGELFASGAITAVGDVVMLVGIVAFMVGIDWQLSLIAFAVLPPLAVAVEFFRRRARLAFRAIRARTAQLNAYLSEQVQGISVVQAYRREAACALDYDEINRAYRDANRAAIKFDALLYSTVESVSAGCIALVLWFAAVRAGWLTEEGGALSAFAAAHVGTVVAFYDYIQRFFVPVRDLSTKYTVVQHSLASAERVFALLDVEEPDAPLMVSCARSPVLAPSAALVTRPTRPAAGLPDEPLIRFERVVFGYRPGLDVLHGVDLDIRRGEKVAVVGATGCGKTTLVSLLLRLYDVGSGAIYVDGVDVRALDRYELRRRFALVPQDAFLFAGTVRENVAVGDVEPDDERVRDALRRVGAWDLCAARGGLDARCGERGQNFSAGERQLIAFARALYRDAEIVILDEATASVDSQTEHALQLAVGEVLRGRTAIVIAHRLSTVRAADRVVVFHMGRIVEEGSHDALLRSDGVYARLYRLQFAQPGADGAALR